MKDAWGWELRSRRGLREDLPEQEEILGAMDTSIIWIMAKVASE